MRHLNLTDELQEKAALFASGAMDSAEAAAYRLHLEEDTCPACGREVKEFRSTLALVASELPAARPSPASKARLMSQALAMSAPIRLPEASGARPRWAIWVFGMSTAAACIVLMLVYRDNTELRRLNLALTSRLSSLESQLSQNLTTLATFTSPDVRVVDLAGQNQNARASGRIFWDRRGNRWLFYAKNLPRVADNLTYQLWFVPATGNPVSVTVFNPGFDGAVSLELPVPPDVMELKAAAVTTEPAGGLPQPSGQFALLGSAE